MGDNNVDIGSAFGLILAVFVFGVLLIFLMIFTRYFGLWIQSQLTRADISFFNLLGMTFRKVSPKVIVLHRAEAPFDLNGDGDIGDYVLQILRVKR